MRALEIIVVRDAGVRIARAIEAARKIKELP